MTRPRRRFECYVASLLAMGFVFALLLMQIEGLPWKWPHDTGWAWLTLSVLFGLILGFAEDKARPEASQGPTPIDSFDTLDRIMTTFHDERFDLNAMEYEPDARRWSGRFIRRVYDPARTTRESGAGGAIRSHFPVVEATLTLHQVSACKTRGDQGIVSYMFDHCERTGVGCTLVFCEELSIALHVDGELAGELRERELDRRGYVEEHGRDAESGIHLEGE